MADTKTEDSKMEDVEKEPEPTRKVVDKSEYKDEAEVVVAKAKELAKVRKKDGSSPCFWGP